jgi:hypothetical protein
LEFFLDPSAKQGLFFLNLKAIFCLLPICPLPSSSSDFLSLVVTCHRPLLHMWLIASPLQSCHHMPNSILPQLGVWPSRAVWTVNANVNGTSSQR